MSLIAVDASSVVQLFFPESNSAQVTALFRDAAVANDDVVGPPLLPIEVTSVVRKRMRRDGLSLARATVVLNDFLAQPIVLLDPPRIHLHALGLATAHSLSAYDAHYVALAEMLGCELWTDDQRLLRAAQRRLPFVRWIGDYRTAGQVQG